MTLETMLLDSIVEAEKKSRVKYNGNGDGDYTRCFNLGISTMSSHLQAILIDKGLIFAEDAKGVTHDNG